MNSTGLIDLKIERGCIFEKHNCVFNVGCTISQGLIVSNVSFPLLKTPDSFKKVLQLKSSSERFNKTHWFPFLNAEHWLDNWFLTRWDHILNSSCCKVLVGNSLCDFAIIAFRDKVRKVTEFSFSLTVASNFTGKRNTQPFF